MKELDNFKNSDFWKEVLLDAKNRASRTDEWNRFDDPNSYYVPGAKESIRSVLIEEELNDLVKIYNMSTRDADYSPAVNYIKIHDDFSEEEELAYLLELKKRIETNPKKYQSWKHGE